MAGQLMRAIRVAKFGGPEVLQLESSVPVPKIGDGQVLVRIFSAGINPVDTYIRTGTYSQKPCLPYTPGRDGAGIIERIGSGVKRFKQGDRVFAATSVTGTYAEYAVCDEASVFHLPDRLNFHEGAAIGVPYFTAYRALIQSARAHPSETVLVHGASGAVGLAAVQLAKSHGMTVIGTAGTEEGMEVVRRSGAQYVFNHRESDYVNKIMDSTKGEGINVILEMLSNVNLGKDLGILSKQGRVIIIGCRGEVQINPRLMMQKESSIRGVSLHSAGPNEWKEMSSAIQSGVEVGWVQPVVDKVYKMERVEKAHVDVIQSSGAKGKLVLAVGEEPGLEDLNFASPNFP